MSHCKLSLITLMKINRYIQYFLLFLFFTFLSVGVFSEKGSTKKNEIAINVKHNNLLTKSNEQDEKKSVKDKKVSSHKEKEKEDKTKKNKISENSEEKHSAKSDKKLSNKEKSKDKKEKEKSSKEVTILPTKSVSEKEINKKEKEISKDKNETIAKTEKKEHLKENSISLKEISKDKKETIAKTDKKEHLKENSISLKEIAPAVIQAKPQQDNSLNQASVKKKEASKTIETKKIIEQKKEVTIPKEEVTLLSESYEELTFKEADFMISARANEFRQGNLGFIKIREIKGKNKFDPSVHNVKWNGVLIPLHPFGEYYLGVLPISPEHPVGVSFLDIEKDDPEKTTIYKFPINVVGTNFPERKMYNPLRIPKRYIIKEHSPETLEFIKKCEDKKQQAFSLNTELKFSSKFVLPLDKIFVTSPFYVKRYYHPSSPGKPHGGVDLRGKPGVPIYAIQDGKVVIAERMFFEGIFTVIDHGSKIFTLYMHQSRIHVKEGEMVKAGQLIGEVGSTGISTGPHLHLGLKVDGNMLNPLNVLKLSLF
jgi:murein DD-endopeptidase